MKMNSAQAGKVKLSQKIYSAVASETPLRDLASNFSVVARNAINEANTLTIEKITIYLKRLPKNLDGFQLVHLSDSSQPFYQSPTHRARRRNRQ